MNKYTVMSSDVMSIALFFASLPMVAADQNHQQPVNNQGCYYGDQYYLQEVAASNSSASQNTSPNYYIFNQFNVIQPQPSSFNAQKLGLPDAPPQVSDKGSPYKGLVQPYRDHIYVDFNKPVKGVRHTCPIEGCTKSYSRSSDLSNHLQVKHFEYAKKNKLFRGNFRCSVEDCPACFTRKTALKGHEKRCHKNLNLKFHHIDVTDAGSNEVDIGRESPEPLEDYQEDEDDHGRQEQAPQPSNKFSLSFICSESQSLSGTDPGL